MSARLTIAIRMFEAARAILRKNQSFTEHKLGNPSECIDNYHIGVEPMLLALSMELALKAWFVFDYDDPKVKRSHNLIKLFDMLKPESQEKLDFEFKQTVAPYHPNAFYIDYGIRDVLYQHQNAFTDWRYLHELKQSMSFDQSVFEATLEMVLKEFRKRYRVEQIQKPLHFRY